MRNKINGRVVVQSVIAVVCLVLMYLISWWFIVPVGIILWLNQRELFGKM